MFINFFLIPGLVTIFFILILNPCAEKIGLMDKPCHRKQHEEHIPLIGGIAIYFALEVTLMLNNNPLPHQMTFLYAVTLLIVVGLIDDYKGLGVKIRILTQVFAGFLMTQYADIKIENLGDLFGFGEIHLGSFGIIFTIFSVIVGVNAFNMIDGMDGLAGSLALITLCSIACLAWLSLDYFHLRYCLIFIASIIVFLVFNLSMFGLSKFKIFLGDTGSTLLGFVICWLAIDASQGEKALINPSTVLWVIAIPLFDSACVTLRRLRYGRSPFHPDREHLHHIFKVAGYSNIFTLVILVALSLFFALIGITCDRFFDNSESISFWFFIFLLFSLLWLINFSWKTLKIARYIKATKIKERRKELKINASFIEKDQIVTKERRAGIDRRFIPSEDEIHKFYSHSNGLWVRLLTRSTFSNEYLNKKKD